MAKNDSKFMKKDLSSSNDFDQNKWMAESTLGEWKNSKRFLSRSSDVQVSKPSQLHYLTVLDSRTSGLESPEEPLGKELPSDILPIIPNINRETAMGQSIELNHAWSAGSRGAFLSEMLANALKHATNPYSLALFLMAFSSDFFTIKNKSSISITVMTEFRSWLKEMGRDKMEKRFLTIPLKIAAFECITKQKNSTLFRLVISIYQIDDIKYILIERIRALCSDEGLYKEACKLVTILKMANQFEIHDFVIPCVLQERFQVVEELMASSLDIANLVVSFFDSYLGEDMSLNNLRDYIEDRGIKNVSPKMIGKAESISEFVYRIVDKFNVNPVCCPNSERRRRSTTLRNALHKRYIQDQADQLSEKDFQEILDITTRHDRVLQEEAIYLLRMYKDIQASARFAIRVGIPLNLMPPDILATIKEIDSKIEVHMALNRMEQEKAGVQNDEPDQIPNESRTISKVLNIIYS